MAKILKQFLLLGALFYLASCSSENTEDKNKTGNNISPDTFFKEVLAVAPDTAMVIKSGVHEERYPNGVLKVKGFYLNGKRNGEWFFWYENGKMWSVGFYKDGLRDGKTSVYYETGQLRYDGQYKLGKTSGKWKFYDVAGKLEKEANYGVEK